MPNTLLACQVTLLNFGPEHAASYNELVEVIRRNLLLADWCDDEHKEVGGSGMRGHGAPGVGCVLMEHRLGTMGLHLIPPVRTLASPRVQSIVPSVLALPNTLLLQSLLNSKQGKWAKEMLKNVRLSCCVAGVLNLVVKVRPRPNPGQRLLLLTGLSWSNLVRCWSN